MARRISILAMVGVLGCAPAAPTTGVKSASSMGASASPSWRPAHWAAPVERQGLPNLHRVDEGFFRGAQPDARGMQSLREMGVKTVVNLRSMHSDRDEIGELPLAYEHIPMVAWHAEDEDVIQFLRIATDAKRRPIFLHCEHGADRTGMMTAIYRVVVQGWSKRDAIEEMTQGGFGYHSLWHNLVSYIEDLDVERIRREAGTLPATASTGLRSAQ